MTRNLKTLGLAFFAILALGAIAAQAASAVNHEFTVTEAPAVLTGVDITDQVFIGTGVLNAVCEVATFDGTAAEKVQDTVKVYPEYSECEEINSGLALHVVNSGCTYEFESDTVVNHAPVELTCNHEDSITLTDSNSLCVIHFSDTHTEGGSTVNQELVGVTYENVGSGSTHDVVVDATVTGITYEMTGAFCELLGAEPGTHHDGIYEGKATVRAFEDEVSNPENHEYVHNSVEIGTKVDFNTAE